MRLVVQREEITSNVASQLIAALNAELSASYPEPGATHFRLDPDEVVEGRGAFLVAYGDSVPLGCGALRRLVEHTAELKRMYVAPDARRQGVARALLVRLEQEACGLGYRHLVLETGIRQGAAVELYRAAGYSVIPAFGEYIGSATSICMGKDLAPSAPQHTR